MASISLNSVVKRFGTNVTLHNVDLEVEDGEFTVFVGPSGCGKSTLLRMIAGLEEISDGHIAIGGTVVNDVALPTVASPWYSSPMPSIPT